MSGNSYRCVRKYIVSGWPTLQQVFKTLTGYEHHFGSAQEDRGSGKFGPRPQIGQIKHLVIQSSVFRTDPYVQHKGPQFFDQMC